MSAVALERPAAPRLLPAAYQISLALIGALALVSQILCYQFGFYSVSMDESLRALMSTDLTFARVLEPLIWPPFYKIIVGVALKIHDDLFWTPRILTQIAGLLNLAALVFLSRRLFNDRTVDLITAVLSVYFFQRFILSIAPASEVYYNLFVLLAAAFVIGWLRSERYPDLLASSICLFLASTVRYEGCFLAAVMLAFLAWRWIRSGSPRTSWFLINAGVLSIFPTFWIVDSLLLYGSLDNLSVASMQGDASGRTILHALKTNHLVRFLSDVGSTPLLAGLLTLIHLSWRDARLRAWAGVLFGALIVVTGVVVATASVAVGAPWRLSGPWALALLPFLAHWLKACAERFPKRHRHRVLIPAVLVCAFGFALESFELVAAYRSDNRFTEDELAAGRYAQALAGRGSKKILLESETLRYLNVLVASNRPERFVLNTGSDPIRISLYTHRSQYWKEHDPAIYEAYVRPKYELSNGLSADILSRNGIGFVMLHSDGYKHKADANPDLAAIANFGDWQLYEVRPPD
jgi:hypothetical protein